jgi:small subunit ribosomal protein S17
MAESKPGKPPLRRKQVKVGVVDSISGEKTVRVTMSKRVRHPLYGKYVRRRTRLLVHDPKREAQLGDTVEVAQCRPISKHKSWRLVRVVKPGTVV